MTHLFHPRLFQALLVAFALALPSPGATYGAGGDGGGGAEPPLVSPPTNTPAQRINPFALKAEIDKCDERTASAAAFIKRLQARVRDLTDEIAESRNREVERALKAERRKERKTIRRTKARMAENERRCADMRRQLEKISLDG